jgi:ATP-dependent Zn protease
MIGNNTENIFIKLILYFFIIFIFGKIFSIIICIGSNTPYKIAYSEEEEYLEDHIEVRNRNYAPALKMNTISFVDFIKNLFIY